jgi:hypothetical protein
MAPLCPAQVELAEPEALAEQELTVEPEEPVGQARLVVEPAVVWAWRRLVEPAVLAAQAEMDLMRVDYQMGRPEEMPGMVVAEALAELQAQWE